MIHFQLFPVMKTEMKDNLNTIKDLRTAAGMTQKTFAEYFGISKRAIESWEGGKRACPEYLFNLMLYKLIHEGIIKA